MIMVWRGKSVLGSKKNAIKASNSKPPAVPVTIATIEGQQAAMERPKNIHALTSGTPRNWFSIKKETFQIKCASR